MKKLTRGISIAGFYLFTVLCLIGGTIMGSRAVSVISEGIVKSDRHIIIIDAGHGGIDGGATSCTGVLESSINLEIALILQNVFHLLGYDTTMIRTTDTSIHVQGDSIASRKVSDLNERVRIVNETENGILISIHQNYFQDSRYSGAQVFYANTQDSQSLAESLQSAFLQTINVGSNRQVKSAKGIYIMEHIECSGVLVECGFLSNPEEEAKLRDEDYQKQLSCVIAASVSKFLDD